MCVCVCERGNREKKHAKLPHQYTAQDRTQSQWQMGPRGNRRKNSHKIVSLEKGRRWGAGTLCGRAQHSGTRSHKTKNRSSFRDFRCAVRDAEGSVPACLAHRVWRRQRTREAASHFHLCGKKIKHSHTYTHETLRITNVNGRSRLGVSGKGGGGSGHLVSPVPCTELSDNINISGKLIIPSVEFPKHAPRNTLDWFQLLHWEEEMR